MGNYDHWIIGMTDGLKEASIRRIYGFFLHWSRCVAKYYTYTTLTRLRFVIPSLPNSSQMITGREAVPFLCSPARMDVLNVQYIYLSLSSPSPEDTPE
jgi:hypothetical protein